MGLSLLKLAGTVLILINMGPCYVNIIGLAQAYLLVTFFVIDIF
jgi:hypothetical protein